MDNKTFSPKIPYQVAHVEDDRFSRCIASFLSQKNQLGFNEAKDVLREMINVANSWVGWSATWDCWQTIYNLSAEDKKIIELLSNAPDVQILQSNNDFKNYMTIRIIEIERLFAEYKFTSYHFNILSLTARAYRELYQMLTGRRIHIHISET